MDRGQQHDFRLLNFAPVLSIFRTAYKSRGVVGVYQEVRMGTLIETGPK